MAWPNDSQENSAALLAKLFSQGGGGGDQLQLRRLQEDRLGELEDQIAGDRSVPDTLSTDRTGRVQATPDPVSAASILRRGLFKKSLESDLANDPSMGTAAHDEVARANTQNEEAATYNDPMQAKMRQDALNAKLAPDVLKANSAMGVAQLNHQSDIEKERIHSQAVVDAARARQPVTVGPDGQPINTKPFGATENRGLESLTNGANLIRELEKTLDPNKNQLVDWLEKQAQYGLYKAGISTSPVSQQRINLAGLLRVMGAAPYVAGSRHFAFMQQAQEHLTNPAASDRFLQTQIDELKRIWPEIQAGIIQVHDNPRKPISFDDPYSDPDYMPR